MVHSLVSPSGECILIPTCFEELQQLPNRTFSLMFRRVHLWLRFVRSHTAERNLL